MPRDQKDAYIGNLKDTIYRIYHRNKQLSDDYRSAGRFAYASGDKEAGDAFIVRANGLLEANDTMRKYLESNGFRDILED